MKKIKEEKQETNLIEEQNEKTEKKSVKIIKNVFNCIINVLIVVILVVSIIIAAMSITAKANNGMPSIFGYTIQSIQSPSMEGGSADFEGGDIKVGDLIIGKSTQFIFELEYEVGDIVTYMAIPEGGSADDPKVPICHRIIEVYEQGGERGYRTMGDNNGKPDQEKGDYSSYIRATDIGSVFYSKDYHGVKISGLGKALDFIQTKLGFFLCILLPMIIFFIIALIRVLLNFSLYRKERDAEMLENAEKEKEEAVKAAVAAALADKEDSAANAEADDLPKSPADMTPEQLEQFKQFMAFQQAQKAAESSADDSEPEPEAEQPSEETEEK